MITGTRKREPLVKILQGTKLLLPFLLELCLMVVLGYSCFRLRQSTIIIVRESEENNYEQ